MGGDLPTTRRSFMSPRSFLNRFLPFAARRGFCRFWTSFPRRWPFLIALTGGFVLVANSPADYTALDCSTPAAAPRSRARVTACACLSRNSFTTRHTVMSLKICFLPCAAHRSRILRTISIRVSLLKSMTRARWRATSQNSLIAS